MEQILTKKTPYTFFDIAANLCDEQFTGIYHDKHYHDSDVDLVMERATSYGVTHLLLSSGSVEDTNISYTLSQKSVNYYITCGIHPCRATEALKLSNNDITKQFNELSDLIEKYKSKTVAIGECGLDYDRFNYSVKEDQNKLFAPHFDLAQKFNLPMYLHSRNTGDDFYNIVKENRNKYTNGVVHSFTENEEELNRYLSLGLYIGLNGNSFKTKENIEVVKKIPLDRIMIETDCPYCEIRSTNAGCNWVDTKFEGRLKKEKMKRGFICKDRNEPCFIIQVLEVLSKVKNVTKDELAKICFDNTLNFFNISK